MKSKIAWVLLSSILMFNCGSDDDDGFDGFPAELVGAWSSSAFSRADCSDAGDDTSCNTAACMALTFSADGSYVGGYPGVSLIGTATGDESKLRLCAEEGCTDVDYTITSGTLSATWIDDEDGCRYTVTMTK